VMLFVWLMLLVFPLPPLIVMLPPLLFAAKAGTTLIVNADTIDTSASAFFIFNHLIMDLVDVLSAVFQPLEYILSSKCGINMAGLPHLGVKNV
jgi:hypothetical protein